MIAPVKKTPITNLSAMILAFPTAFPVWAEPAIEEIVVTAARRTVTAESLSQAATIVVPESTSADALLTESLRYELGVYLQQTTPGQGAPIIRGLRGSAV